MCIRDSYQRDWEVERLEARLVEVKKALKAVQAYLRHLPKDADRDSGRAVAEGATGATPNYYAASKRRAGELLMEVHNARVAAIEKELERLRRYEKNLGRRLPETVPEDEEEEAEEAPAAAEGEAAEGGAEAAATAAAGAGAATGTGHEEL